MELWEAPSLADPSGDGAVTVGRLADLLAPTGITMSVAPARADAAARAGFIHDGTGPLPTESGGVVLAVGVRPDDGVLVQMLAAAAAAGHVALTIKAYGRDITALCDCAASSGVALFVVPDEMSWTHVHSLVVSCLGAEDGGIDELTEAGEELFTLADSIADTFGGSVAIEDLDTRVVGYSSRPGQVIDDVRIAGILGRKVPGSDTSHAQYQRVYAADGVTRFPADGHERARAAIAVRAGAVTLGSIWALEERAVDDDGRLPDECVQALVRGARLAARHLMNAADAAGPLTRRRRSSFDALLAGHALGRLDLARLGVSETQTVTAVAPRTPGERGAVAIETARLVQRHYRAFRPQSVVSTNHESIYILSGEDDTGSAAHLARDVLSTVETSLGVELCAAVSATYPSASDVPLARAEVDDVIRCLRSAGVTERVAVAGDVRSRLLLLHAAELVRREARVRHPGVLRMREEAAAGSPLWHTVLTWLEEGCSPPAAARRLIVHENTVRYRIARARERYGLDLDEPDERLAVWLQVRAASIEPAPAP